MPNKGDDAWDWWHEMDRAPRPKREWWIRFRSDPRRGVILSLASLNAVMLISFAMQFLWFAVAGSLLAFVVLLLVWERLP